MRILRPRTIRARLLAAFLGVVGTSLIPAGVGAAGLTALWRGVDSIYRETEGERASLAQLLAALEGLAYALTDYQTTGSPAGRAGPAQGAAQVQLLLGRVDPGLFENAEERSLVLEARALGSQIESLSRDILRRADGWLDREALAMAEALRQRLDRAMPLVRRALAASAREMQEEIRGIRALLWRLAVAGVMTDVLTPLAAAATAKRVQATTDPDPALVRLPLLAAPPAPRLLLVEEEGLLRVRMAAALANAGYAVAEAASGAEALAALAGQPPDLVVLDILLPDGRGWDVLRQVRANDWTRAVPVLSLTGLDSVQADEALARGADEFLAKPVSAQVLIETAGRLLRQPARHRDAAGRGTPDRRSGE